MIVLDAAALVDVVLDQPQSTWVLDLLTGQEICAPAHQPAEVLSALSRLRRAGVLDRETADESLDEAMALEQELVLPSPAHTRRAAQLGDRIRVLDGLYVALADERDCPLVSTHRRLAGADAPCEVLTPWRPG